MSEDINFNAMTTFIKTARRGDHGAASSGERAAYQLALCAEKVSDLMMSLDSDRQEGFLVMLRCLACPNNRDTVLRWIK